MTVATRPERECANPPCPIRFVPRRDDHESCSPKCRTAVWKLRNGYSDRRRVTRPAEASRNASRTGRRKVSGMQVPLARLERELTAAFAHDSTARTIALECARAALPERQRQRLEARS